ERPGRRKVLGVTAETTASEREMTSAVTEPRKSGKERQKTKPRTDRKREGVGALIARQDPALWQTVTFRDGPQGKPMTSRFCLLIRRWLVKCVGVAVGGLDPAAVRAGAWAYFGPRPSGCLRAGDKMFDGGKR